LEGRSRIDARLAGGWRLASGMAGWLLRRAAARRRGSAAARRDGRAGARKGKRGVAY